MDGGGGASGFGGLTGAARMLVRALIGAPVALPPALAERWPELAEARYRRGGLPVRVGGWALGQATVAAITLWRTIWLAPHEPLDPALLLHEIRHVHQFRSGVTFPVRYLWESVRRGYEDNRYEADARAYACERLRAARPPRRSNA